MQSSVRQLVVDNRETLVGIGYLVAFTALVGVGFAFWSLGGVYITTLDGTTCPSCGAAQTGQMLYRAIDIALVLVVLSIAGTSVWRRNNE